MRHRPRHVVAQVLLDEAERQIQFRRHAGRGPDRVIGDEDAVRLDLDIGMPLLQCVCISPVGRCASPRQQAGLGQHEGPGAQPHGPTRTSAALSQRMQQV
ncbi:hypothetical protein D3C71_1819580 [compost metagenome]